MFNVDDESPVLVHPFIVMNSYMKNVAVQILKDDRCNKNIVSSNLFRKNRNYFQVKINTMRIQKSRNGCNEETSFVIKTKR